jgi:excinuclease ABC subunit A
MKVAGPAILRLPAIFPIIIFPYVNKHLCQQYINNFIKVFCCYQDTNSRWRDFCTFYYSFLLYLYLFEWIPMIELKNVRVHNLKSVSLQLEAGKLICFTGVSGSGKSSLAFDTIYVEGQRRYVESLSQHARRFIGELPKPDVDYVGGITPTISIEQKTAGRNPRSTVGTITEIYDYLRVLFARVGIAHCPVSGEPVMARSREEIITEIQSRPDGKKIIILAPHVRAKKGEFKDDFEAIIKKGFTRVRIDGTIQLVSDDIELEKNHAHDVDIVIDRLEVNKENALRIAESVTMALEVGSGSLIIIDYESGDENLYSTMAYSPKSGLSYPPLDPQDFSFNSPQGMCPECQGMGVKHEYVLDRVIDKEKSISEDFCSIASSYKTVRYGNIYDNLARIYGFSVDTPWKKLSPEAKKIILYGTEKKWTRMHFVHPVTGAIWSDVIQWRGVLFEAYDRYQKAKSENYKRRQEALMHLGICPSCHGARIKPFPASTEFHGKKIFELTEMPIEDALAFLENVKLTSTEELIGHELLKEIKSRFRFLKDVGLEYLQLSRSAPTLSGGEAQRVRLASQIGSGLVGITYVLDEPSIGLHPQDNKKLIQSLKNLRDKNNTVIVVEHDEETIRASDHIVDFGPKAGLQGGEIVYSGDLKGLLQCKESLTSQYLSKRLEIEIPKKRRPHTKSFLSLTGAQHNNLKDVEVDIPLGTFVAITGVSGSGKSSLFLETLFPALSNELSGTELTVGKYKAIDGLASVDKVIEIDQSPIGRTPRSNPATYVGIFDEIRALYAKLPESKARGYTNGRFSFNVREGSCPECRGLGMVKVDMDFLEDAWVECPHCKGLRFDEETLSIRFKEKNIHDVLEMDVMEALELFANIPYIATKLDTLRKVGLDYIKLGQSSTTLSGGEAQRIKLARELTRPATGKTVYILDEPTTGLHFYDIKHLLDVLHALVDRGNTVVVIEHNMDLVKTADWVIDMGPSSGEKGGQIIATGTPEEIAAIDSPTGHAVHDVLATTKKKIEKAKKEKPKPEQNIVVLGARQNNLQGCDVEIPRGQMTVITGPSGAGKSSLAFETIYAEGQRRYVESLSPYVRQFVKQCPKPKVDHIEGLSPTVAIEQRLHATNPRSTVGTMTEVYDYLRVLYARIGLPRCPKTGFQIRAISKEHVVEKMLSYPAGERLYILAQIELKRTDRLEDVLARLQKQGFLRIRFNKTYYELGTDLSKLHFDPKRKNELMLVIDRFKVDPALKMRMLEAVSTASQLGKGKLVIQREDKDVLFNLAFAVEETGESYPEITPQTFAFNTPHGMCPDCQGLGFQWGFDITALPFIKKMTAHSLIITLWGFSGENPYLKELFRKVLKYLKIDSDTPLLELPNKKLQEFLNGIKEPIEGSIDGVSFRVLWRGISQALATTAKNGSSEDGEPRLPEEWEAALRESECPSCHGARLNPLARAVTIDKKSIVDVSKMQLSDLETFIHTLPKPAPEDLSLKQVHDELALRTQFLNQIGLSYISLDRRASSLSGGEAERVRLARQIGSGLTGVLYVLDEPTIGLHPKDVETLLQALNKLKSLGNTIVAVEHDPQLIQEADFVIEMGPGSGKLGGQVVAQGKPNELMKNSSSLTGKYLKLRERKKKPKRKAESSKLKIINANIHNLQSLHVTIPLGQFTCLTGVSGSGKSTLLYDVIHNGLSQTSVSHPFTIKGEHDFQKIIMIDQKPIGHTLRSDVATYMDVQTPMRYFFAQLPDARAKGLEPKHFSANHRKGMCTTCWGLGYKRVAMHFLPPVKITCPECKGMRLNNVSLAIRYQEKNLGEILKMSVEEARILFSSHPRITRLLDMLISLGLGYIQLGQEMQTVSLGEGQRIKLAYELSKRTSGNALYLLDEPTTGLHGEEVEKIVTLLQKLVEKGHTVIAIEHNLDFIQTADHIIDLGPGPGDKGGKIVSEGTPDEVAKDPKSVTGKFLKERLQ